MTYERGVQSKWDGSKKYSKKAFFLFKGYFVSRNILRKYPLLGSLHRAMDGALLAVIFFGALMTGLALHSQHLWTRNFSRLQTTRDLTHRLEESTAVLERHFLKTVFSPTLMVATKSSDLIYIDRSRQRKISKRLFNIFRDKFSAISYPITRGF
ncbi:hypothetical protein [Prochlorococcus marinus]|uniref:hypothetical protein n=1 Tax=Prochlorococcus marinus TaxID=1219 RepID=UPI0022B572C7|nr:hypothetical protein [Prochlorococcus marinus]